LLLVIYNVFGKMKGDFGDRLARLIWPLALSALAVSLLAVYQKITGNLIDNPFWAAAATRRVISVFGYPNAVGLYVGPIILLTIGLVFYYITSFKKGLIINFQFSIFKKKSINTENLKIENLLKIENWSLIIIYISIILSLLSIFFAKSIGAAFGVGMGLVTFAMLASKQSRRMVIALLLFGFVVAMAIAPLRHAAIKYATFQDFSGQVRLAQWHETWQMLSDGRILTGAGLANFQATLAPYHVAGFYFNKNNEPDFQFRLLNWGQAYRARHWQPLEIYLYPHNLILNFWTELGLLGVIAFVWLIVRVVVSSGYLVYRKFKDSPERFIIIGALCALVASIAHGLVDVPYFKNDLSVLFWVVVGIVGLGQLDGRNSPKE
jgi:O-antigen ligase